MTFKTVTDPRVLTPEFADLAAAAAQLGDVVTITAGDEHGELVVVRTVNGEQISFLVYLMRGEDGIWRIESM